MRSFLSTLINLWNLPSKGIKKSKHLNDKKPTVLEKKRVYQYKIKLKKKLPTTGWSFVGAREVEEVVGCEVGRWLGCWSEPAAADSQPYVTQKKKTQKWYQNERNTLKTQRNGA